MVSIVTGGQLPSLILVILLFFLGILIVDIEKTLYKCNFDYNFTFKCLCYLIELN